MTLEMGSHSEQIIGKSSQNSPTWVLNFWGSIMYTMCILFLYTARTLLQVVSHYDLNVLSVSVTGFQKKFG